MSTDIDRPTKYVNEVRHDWHAKIQADTNNHGGAAPMWCVAESEDNRILPLKRPEASRSNYFYCNMRMVLNGHLGMSETVQKPEPL